MKKFLAGFLSICVCFMNVVYAIGSVSLNTIDSITVEKYAETQGVEYQKLLQAGEKITMIFREGDTGLQLTLPSIVVTSEECEITKYLDNDAVTQLIEKQVSGLAEDVANKKVDELLSITNQIRALYRKAEVTGETGEKEEYYVLNINDLDNKNENLALNVGENNEAELLYNGAEISSNSEENQASNSVNSSQSGITNVAPEAGTSEVPSGGEGSQTTTLNSQTELKEPEDIHGYQFWELLNLDARSAEYEVLEKCWGEDCGQAPENIVPKNEVIHSEKIKVGSFEHTFYMHQYYAQDVTTSAYCGDRSEMSEILSILTKPNRDKFEIYVDNWLESNVIYYKYVGSVRVEDQTETTRQREIMKNLIMEQVAILAQNYYARIGVITKDHKEKSFFVFEPWVYNLNKTVFAETSTTNGNGGELIGIRTDEYTDIFTWNDLGRGMTDILNSADPKARTTDKKQYRLKDSNFYLCKECSKCEKCEKLVAYGEEAEGQGTGNGWYLSKFCANHACPFVWKWLVDATNNGPQEEGVRCREDKLAYYCENHKCGNGSCINAIVGKSKVADTGGVTDVRDTGATTEDRYSGYCATHKCRYVDCENQRLSLDTTPWGVSNGESTIMHTPRHCTEHETSCVLCGANDEVSAEAYQATGAMICDSCAGILTDVDFQIETYGDAVISARIVNPNAKTLIFFGGTQVKGDIEGTTNVVRGVENLEGYNIICVAVKPEDMVWEAKQEYWEKSVNSTITYLQDLAKSGKIDSSQICVDGFSDGGYAAYYLTDQLQGTSVTDNSGNTAEFDMTLRLLDSPNNPTNTSNKNLKATWKNVKAVMDRGAEVGIYDFNLGNNSTEAYVKRLKENDERVTGGFYQVDHSEAVVRQLYEEGELNLE